MSERRLGNFLKLIPRDELILSTKVGRVLDPVSNPKDLKGSPWIGGDPFKHRFDYSYDGVMRSFDESLKRLQTDRIDLLLIHDLDTMHHATDEGVSSRMRELTNEKTGGWKALAELRNSKAIRAVGSGVNELGTIPRMLDAVDLDFFLVALRYTLMEQETLQSEIPRCVAADVGIIVGGVFNSGITATGVVEGAKYNYRDPARHEREKVNKIAQVCRTHHVEMAAAALQFPLGHPAVAGVIPGAINPEQVTVNLELLQMDLSHDLWLDLKQQGLLRMDAPCPDPRDMQSAQIVGVQKRDRETHSALRDRSHNNLLAILVRAGVPRLQDGVLRRPLDVLPVEDAAVPREDAARPVAEDAQVGEPDVAPASLHVVEVEERAHAPQGPVSPGARTAQLSGQARLHVVQPARVALALALALP